MHGEMLLRSPRDYLMAVWWRLRRKRVRARNRFAVLFGHSSLAYEFWLLTRGRTPSAAAREDVPHSPIIVLVDVRGATDDRPPETEQMLAEQGVTILSVGGRDMPGLASAADHIDWREAPWLMPIPAGDRLASGAGSAYRRAIAGATKDGPQLIYADDDLLDGVGKRMSPHCKPDWNAELFRHVDYLSGACILQVSRDDLVASGNAVDAPHRLVERALAGGANPVHVRQILHHRRVRPEPKLPPATIRSSADLPLATVIVPTRNRQDLLRTCLKGLADTDYPRIEVLVVDNDSDDPASLCYLAGLDPAFARVLRHPGAFNFSAINNRAAAEAKGELLCLLNNDIEIINPGWLRAMAEQALRPDVGAVGAQLLYPDGRIQHAGVVLGVGGAAAHAHRLLRPDDEGYFRRHALPQFVSAVTAACLVVSRDRFRAVDGLDEQRFRVAFNDVDLCMRLNAHGWQSLYEPRAVLIHHESVSRGLDRDPVGAARFAGEMAALQALWRTAEIVDPYHHPLLSRSSEDFVLDLEI